MTTRAAAGGSALPPFVKRVDPPRLGRRLLSEATLRLVDAGWTRRTPLGRHLVVCGFPRAGSTLLALILQTAYQSARAYPRERSAVRVAYDTRRSHRLLISKRPDDVFFMDDVRRIYASRRPDVRFILTLRDPRAILTSMHAGRAGDYYVTPERWRATYQQFVRSRATDDSLIVRFEDLVASVGDVQRQVARFLGRDPELPFEEFLDHVPPDFKQTALNGLRALDARAVDRWRDPRHHERLARMLDALPELPEVLVTEGYEADDGWSRAYRNAPAPRVERAR